MSNSLAERASSSSSGGSTFSLISLTVTPTLCREPSASSNSISFVSPGVHADDALLDLLDDGAAAELDHVVAPRLAAGTDEIEDDGVLAGDRPALDRDELGDRGAQRVELVLDELLRHVRLDDPDLELLPVGQLRLRLDGDGGGELPVLVGRVGELEVVLRLLDRAEPRLRRGVPEPAADVALDRLGHQALLADPLQEHLPRHLALAEAGDLDALREVGGGVLDGVVDVVRRHLDGQPDAVLGQLFDLGLHPAIQADPFSPSSAPSVRGLRATRASLLAHRHDDGRKGSARMTANEIVPNESPGTWIMLLGVSAIWLGMFVGRRVPDDRLAGAELHPEPRRS